MAAEEVDEYLRRLEEPKRSTLQALRRTILEIVPHAEEVISSRVPADVPPFTIWHLPPGDGFSVNCTG